MQWALDRLQEVVQEEKRARQEAEAALETVREDLEAELAVFDEDLEGDAWRILSEDDKEPRKRD